MLRAIFFMIVLAWPMASRAEVEVPICPVTNPEYAKRVAEAIKGLGQCRVHCTGCGCKAGPGYRMPDPPGHSMHSRKKGDCAAWAKLERTCGKDNEACRKECTKVVLECRDREIYIKSILRSSAGCSEAPQTKESHGPIE